jgi:hypothetical protein
VVLMLGFHQVLSAISLFVFAACVAAFVWRTAIGTRTLSGLTLGGGTLAAAFLLLAALLSWVLALTVSEGEPAHASTLHYLIFLSGGPAHLASLASFVGAGSIAALRTKALPGWISWVGIAAAAISLLCLVSLVWYPASIFIPLGRVLSFVWSVAVSVVLVRMTKDTVPCKSSPRKRGHEFWSVVYEEPRPPESTPWSPWSVQFRGGTRE